MNVEFGYGRMKGMHRKTIFKHLKVDLYISSNPIQKKSSVKIRENYQKKKEVEETNIIQKV